MMSRGTGAAASSGLTVEEEIEQRPETPARRTTTPMSGDRPRPRGSPRWVDALLSVDSSQSTVAGLLSVATEERGHDIRHRHAVGSDLAQNSGVRPADPDGGVVRVRGSAPLRGEHPPHGALAYRGHPRDFPYLCRRRHGPRVYLAPCITRHGARTRTGRLDQDRPASAGIDPTRPGRRQSRRRPRDRTRSAGNPTLRTRRGQRQRLETELRNTPAGAAIDRGKPADPAETPPPRGPGINPCRRTWNSRPPRTRGD